MLEQFHFIHPLWLAGLLPLALLAWFAFRPGVGANAWRRVVDARLLPLMMATPGSRGNRSAVWLVSLGWLVAIAALADPTWQRKPQPVFQTGAARVVVLDLADSMNDADLAPSRLARARYKVEDVLAQSAEGQTGLVVYAGDAFTVSPLTRDANTIRSLLQVLEPDLMPSQGSRADLGLLKAGELLKQAGATSGQVLLIADGVEAGKMADAQRAAARLRSEGYRVSVLGVGTAAGAPLTDEAGKLVRESDGALQSPRLDAAALQSLAQAGGGQYRAITDSGEALHALLNAGTAKPVQAGAGARSSATAWKELGPAIVVLLLPLAALAFRRNWLVSAALLAALAVPSQAAMASTWSDLWQRPDQQAAKALSAGDYAAAAKVAPDADRRGSAQYKLGNFAPALDDFSHLAGADADYNRGNALARLGRYPDAVAAYDKAIAETSSNDDAKANKAAVEALMKQSPPQQNQKQQGQQGQQGNQGQQGQQGQQGNKGQGQQNQAGGQGQQQQPGSKGDSAAGSQGSGAAGAGEQGQLQDASSKAAQGKSQDGQSAQLADGAKARAPASDGQQAALNGGSPPQPSSVPDQRGAQAASATPAPTPAPNAFAQALQKLEHWAGAKTDGEAAATQARTAGGNPPDSSSAGKPPGSAASRAAARSGDAQPLDSEEKLAAQQWLGRIPDDPGGLLRRKFLYQYRQRAQQGDSGND